MLRYALVGAVAGSRSMLPLAALAARGSGFAPGAIRSARLLTAALAAAELLGDKLPGAPDRISLPGVLARLASGAIVAAALAPTGRRRSAAALGAGAAVLAGYLSFAARMRALHRHGQIRTGLVEDALALVAATLVVRSPRRDTVRESTARDGRSSTRR